MKIKILSVLFLFLVCQVGILAVDIDEALPHYKDFSSVSDPDSDGNEIWLPAVKIIHGVQFFGR